MTAAGGSVVVRRQLGDQLRRLRVLAGKSVADVTEAGLGSKAKMSRIETGKGTVRFADVQALCWHPDQRMEPRMTETPWIKASRSDSQDDCVELRRHGGMIEVRDSKDAATGPTLRFTDAEFAAWLHGVKHGEFDHLVPGA